MKTNGCVDPDRTLEVLFAAASRSGICQKIPFDPLSRIVRTKWSAVLFLLCLFCLTSCATKDENYYLGRAEEVKGQLIVELESSRTLQDLFARQESLTLLFDELSKVAIRAAAYQLKHKKRWEIPVESSLSSQRLAQEMRRVLEIPGARAFVEKCQAKGFDRIDVFEKSRERNTVKGSSY